MNKLKMNIHGLSDYFNKVESGVVPRIKHALKSSQNQNAENLFILGGALNKDGAQLLLESVDAQSLCNIMWDDGGACKPFSAEGNFSSGFSLIRQTMLSNHYSVIIQTTSDTFSTQRWSENNNGLQCRLIKPNNILGQALNFLRYIIGKSQANHDYYLSAHLINHCATDQGKQHCHELLNLITSKLGSALEKENLKLIFDFVNDDTMHPFVKLIYINKVAKVHGSALQPHVDSHVLKYMSSLFCDTKYLPLEDSKPKEIYFEKQKNHLSEEAKSNKLTHAKIAMMGTIFSIAAQVPATLGIAGYSLIAQSLAMFSLCYVTIKLGSTALMYVNSNLGQSINQDTQSSENQAVNRISDCDEATLDNTPQSLLFSQNHSTSGVEARGFVAQPEREDIHTPLASSDLQFKRNP
tara:strand:- start:39197 stop:40423 length:1227 start_codon:yes stop_codon:yes gene_type:complete